MAADLHICVLEGVTEQDYADFNLHTLGSKFCDLGKRESNWDGLYEKFSACPQVWIGEVSWLKAALFNEPDTFIPHPVQAVTDIISEDFPAIDDPLITRISEATRSVRANGQRRFGCRAPSCRERNRRQLLRAGYFWHPRNDLRDTKRGE